MTPVFRCVGHEWVTPLGALRPGSGPQVPSREHNWSHDELEPVSGGDLPGNLRDWNGQALCRRPTVDDDGVDGVLPQRGLPPAGSVRPEGGL
jgi:hypothetical protein